MDPFYQDVSPLFTGGNRILRACAFHISWLHAYEAIPVDLGNHIHLGDLGQDDPVSEHASDVGLGKGVVVRKRGHTHPFEGVWRSSVGPLSRNDEQIGAVGYPGP